MLFSFFCSPKNTAFKRESHSTKIKEVIARRIKSILEYPFYSTKQSDGSGFGLIYGDYFASLAMTRNKKGERYHPSPFGFVTN
jgi:hypothetical protein